MTDFQITYVGRRPTRARCLAPGYGSIEIHQQNSNGDTDVFLLERRPDRWWEFEFTYQTVVKGGRQQ